MKEYKDYTDEELKEQHEYYKDIVKIPHSVKDVVILYAIEDELERREQSVDKDEFEEQERIEGVDEE